VPQEPIELETGPVTIGGPKNLDGVGPAPVLADNNPPTQFATINQPVLQKMPLPPKRDDFMSIGGPGGGLSDLRRDDFAGRPNQGTPSKIDAFFAAFPDAPQRPRMSTMDIQFYTDPITGERKRGSSTDVSYRNRLKEYLDANPAAMESYQQNVLSAPITPVQDPIGTPNIIDPTITPTPVPEPVTTPAPVTPPEPVTPPASTTVAANQPRPAPTEVAPTQTDPVATTTTTNAGQAVNNPFASSVRQVASGLDPLTEQLLFGVGGQGGFIPGAMRAAERTFYDDEGNPIVIDEQVAGFSPDQIAAIEMQRQSLGLQDPYIQDARSALQASMQAYDPSITGQFFNPFEDRVVQQTIQDVMEQGAKSDIGALAGDIARGGQSAFGSRARLGAAERQEALGRGLSEALGSLRARGFSEAQRAGMGEFARQKAAQRAGASGIAGLGAQAAGASLSDIGALFGMGTQQQTQAQAMLDAQRRNLLQRQMTPLLQYQALQPFVSMAPAGQFQTITDFAPRPSAMQIGIGTGLQTFGALGNLYGGK
tara:strand:+ start:5330 stop:6943 length:1614 start_codon:yes stop_codon:yes gene_type:complete